MDLPSRLDLYSVGRSYLLQRAARIDPSQVDVLGSDANVFVGSNSVVASTVVRQLSYSVARHFLDGAEGDDLDRLAYDRYTMTRKGASNAVGAVTISRVSILAGGGTVPSGTLLTTRTGAQYITTTPATFGASDTTSTANVRAVQAGKASQAGVNSITKFLNVGSLFDRTLVVTNPVATAGGEDVEDDDTFRSRIRDFWNTARRGILAAIEFGAKTVAGVATAQAIEALTTGAQPARVVILYIADSSGVANDALAAIVRVALDDFRAGGIAVIIIPSIPLIVNLELQLQFRANVDTVGLSNNVRAAIVEFINSLPVNGTLSLQQLYTVLQRYSGDGLIPSQNNIVYPVGDLVPAVGQTIRTTLDNVVLL